MYKLTRTTELMKSHKAAQTLSDQSNFAVLQTSDGRALFFGIGDDKILYLTVEQTGVSTGWTPIDLTTEIKSLVSDKLIVAKDFAISQDSATGDITIAQVVTFTDEAGDEIFVLTNLSNAPNAAWMQSSANRAWLARDYDDQQHHIEDEVHIEYVHILTTSSANSSRSQQLVAGLRDSFIRDYVIDLNPVASKIWTEYPSAQDFDSLFSLVTGLPQGAPFAGTYRLYSLNSQTALTFTPWRGLVQNSPPDPILLTVPAGASSLATVPVDNTGASDIYVAASAGIYLFAAANQVDENSVPVQILSSPMIASVQSLRVHASATQFTLWGQTNTGLVFCSRCALGSQTNSSAWSAPIPIASGVDQLSTMLDLTTGSDVLFAHTHSQDILKLTQDPISSQWRTDSILLPTIDIDDVVESYTYSTRIEVVDENQLPLGGQSFTVTSLTSCSFYVDDAYMRLSPSLPLQLTADASGSVTIVQHTRTLGAPCYDLIQGDGTTINVNPMNTPLARMQSIKSGADLDVQVTDEQGVATPLVPATVPRSSINAVAQGIGQFVQTSNGLPQNGSLQTSQTRSRTHFVAAAGPIWGMTFQRGNITYYEGHQALAAAGFATSLAIGKTTGEPSAIEAFAGDIFRWLEEFADDVTQFFVQVIDGVTDFFITIGNAIYTFVMACIDDVVHGIQFVLDMIEVGWEKLVQFVGFIFNWSDILRTHAVLNKIFTLFAEQAVASLPSYQQSLDSAIANAKQYLKNWAAPQIAVSASSTVLANPQSPAASSPQANYGTFQAKTNAGSTTSSFTPSFSSNTHADSLLEGFQNFLATSEGGLADAFADLEKLFNRDYLATLSVTDLFKQIIDILLGDVLLSIAQAAGDLLIQVLGLLIEGVIAALTSKLEIPVLSWLYKKYTDADLTFLDLVCLVAAIPATILGKIVTGHTPFPDDAFTAALLAAPNFAALRQLYLAPPVVDPHNDLALVGNTDLAKSLYFAGGWAALAGAALVLVLNLVKKDTPNNYAIYALYGCAYMLYCGPDIFGQAASANDPTWDVDLNTTITGLAILKTFADVSLATPKKDRSKAVDAWWFVSPGIEGALAIFWEFATIASLVRDHQTPSNIVGFVGNSLFNLGGIASLGEVLDTPQTRTAAQIAEILCTAFYGVMMVVQGAMLLGDS